MITPKEAVKLVEANDDHLSEFRATVMIAGWQFSTATHKRDTMIIILEDLPEDTELECIERYKAWEWEEMC